MTTKELLTCARDRIKDPERWTQQAMARNSSGIPCGYDVPSACQWCALGSLCRCSSELDCERTTFTEAHDLLQLPAFVNDVRGHAAVMEMYSSAIAQAEAAS